MTHPSKRKRLVFSLLISVAVSLLPLAFQLFIFFWLPGSLIGWFLFGPQILYRSFGPVRAFLSAIIWSIVIYFGSALWTWGQSPSKRYVQTPPASKYMLAFWCILLLPWLLVAPLSGMAFDGGYTAEAYVFVWSVWTFPITVIIAAVFRKWVPWITLLPILNLTGCGASMGLHH